MAKKRTSNAILNITKKTKDRANIDHVTLNNNQYINH